MAKPVDGSKSGGDARGQMSTEDRAQFERRITDLGSRLDKSAGSKDGKTVADAEADAARSKAMGMGFSIAAQLVAGVIVGGAIGYFLDHWLGTVPWLMVLFLMLGFAAGLMNVIRTAREMQKISEAQSKGAKSVADDEGEDK